jgi:hypothetical protein
VLEGVVLEDLVLEDPVLEDVLLEDVVLGHDCGQNLPYPLPATTVTSSLGASCTVRARHRGGGHGSLHASCSPRSCCWSNLPRSTLSATCSRFSP